MTKTFLGNCPKIKVFKITLEINSAIFLVSHTVIIIITLPLGAQVYCAPVRATVHKSSRVAAPAGFDHRESGSRAVGS